MFYQDDNELRAILNILDKFYNASGLELDISHYLRVETDQPLCGQCDRGVVSEQHALLPLGRARCECDGAGGKVSLGISNYNDSDEFERSQHFVELQMQLVSSTVVSSDSNQYNAYHHQNSHQANHDHCHQAHQGHRQLFHQTYRSESFIRAEYTKSFVSNGGDKIDLDCVTWLEFESEHDEISYMVWEHDLVECWLDTFGSSYGEQLCSS